MVFTETALEFNPTAGARDVLARPLLDAGVLDAGPLTLNLRLFSAVLDAQPLPLTRLEFDLLVYLVLNGDRVVSQLEILGAVLGARQGEVNSVVRVHVSRIRAKLGAHAGLIQTVRGRGFRFVGDPEDAPPVSQRLPRRSPTDP